MTNFGREDFRNSLVPPEREVFVAHTAHASAIAKNARAKARGTTLPRALPGESRRGKFKAAAEAAATRPRYDPPRDFRIVETRLCTHTLRSTSMSSSRRGIDIHSWIVLL